MSNDSTIDDLKTQMASAAFGQAVKEHVDQIEIMTLLAAKLSGIPPDVLVVILAITIGRILMTSCPDQVREHYADIIKDIIDRALALSKE
jgi:hypothetical protein